VVSDVHFSSRNDDWSSPAWVVQAAEKMMGAIDLDPASPTIDGPIPASLRYTKETNGLIQDWNGRVFLNPPYGREIGIWVKKAIQEYDAGRMSEAIILLPARTDTKWFDVISSFPWCAVRGRIKFGNLHNPAPFPSAIIYMGERVERFTRMFSACGTVFRRAP